MSSAQVHSYTLLVPPGTADILYFLRHPVFSPLACMRLLYTPPSFMTTHFLFPSKESFSLFSFCVPRLSPPILYTRFQQTFRKGPNSRYLRLYRPSSLCHKYSTNSIVSPKQHRQYVICKGQGVSVF